MQKTDMPATGPEPSARERIVQTAHDLFYREGIRATGIDRVIAQARVTKVTFYRHFPSKNDLVAAYLDYRHARWMAWFSDALGRCPPNAAFPLEPVLFALREWFSMPDFRGCAFINGVVELDGVGPWVADVSLRHKQDMLHAMGRIVPAGALSAPAVEAAAMAVDGAIVRAQMEKAPEAALVPLALLLQALCRSVEH